MGVIVVQFFCLAIFVVTSLSSGFVLPNNVNETFEISPASGLDKTFSSSASEVKEFSSDKLIVGEYIIINTLGYNLTEPNKSDFQENNTFVKIEQHSGESPPSDSSEDSVYHNEFQLINNTYSATLTIAQTDVSENRPLMKVGQHLLQSPTTESQELVQPDVLHTSDTADSNPLGTVQSVISVLIRGVDSRKSSASGSNEENISLDSSDIFNSDKTLLQRSVVLENDTLKNAITPKTPELSSDFNFNFKTINYSSYKTLELSEFPKNYTVLNIQLEYPDSEKPNELVFKWLVGPDDPLLLRNIDSNYMTSEQSAIPTIDTITATEQESPTLQLSNKVVLPDDPLLFHTTDSNYMTLERLALPTKNDTINITEHDSLNLQLSDVLLLPDDPLLFHTTDSNYMTLERLALPTNDTINITEHDSLTLQLSDVLLLPDDPLLFHTTDFNSEIIDRLSENETITESGQLDDLLSYTDLAVLDELIQPDSIVETTTYNNAIFDKSVIGIPSPDEIPIFSSSAQSVTSITIDDSSENDESMQPTTERVLEEKNIFDVPKKECENGMKRDRRGKCRPVLHRTSGK